MHGLGIATKIKIGDDGLLVHFNLLYFKNLFTVNFLFSCALWHADDCDCR